MQTWSIGESGSLAWDVVTAAIILAVFVCAGVLVCLFWRRFLTPLARRVGMDPDHSVLAPLGRFILSGLFIGGLYYFVSSLEVVRSTPTLAELLAKAAGIVWALLAIWTMLRIFNRAARWYVQKVATHSDGRKDIGYQINLLRKIVNAVALGLGLLYVLRAAGMAINPLLASGAIIGMTVALGMHPVKSAI